MSEDWVKNRKKTAAKIKKVAPKDRLGYVDGCIQCIAAIGQSNQGWLQWLSNPTLMNEFEENDLKDFFSKFREFSLSYIEFDIDSTQKGVRPPLIEKPKPYG
jgi:hypothetical protein